MISRVANSCFWLNRYIERAEVLARMLSVNLSFQLDVDMPHAERWRPLVIVTGQQEHYLDHTSQQDIDDGDTAQWYLTWEPDNPSSIWSSIAAARENARRTRETISLEMWETVNDLWLWLGQKATKKIYTTDRHAFYTELRNRCLLYHGVAEATMLHDEPFRFMRLGTTLERAGQTARILDVKYHSLGPTKAEEETPSEAAQWLVTLRFCSGVEPFFKRELQNFTGRAVADFLIMESAFPRSVRCNLVRSRNLLKLIRGSQGAIGDQSLDAINAMLSRLSALETEPPADGLHELLTWLVDSLAEVTHFVNLEFFDPPPVAVQSQSQSA